MTIKITDLVAATKKEIENQESYIKALNELKVINGLTHRQHVKINKVLEDNNFEIKYSFVFNKADANSKGSAYLHNLENDQKYFYANPSTYDAIIISDETINEANQKLEVLKEAHSYTLEKEEEIKRLDELLEDSKKKIIEAIKGNSNIAGEFHEKFLKSNSSSLYVNVDSSLHLSIYS